MANLIKTCARGTLLEPNGQSPFSLGQYGSLPCGIDDDCGRERTECGDHDDRSHRMATLTIADWATEPHALARQEGFARDPVFQCPIQGFSDLQLARLARFPDRIRHVVYRGAGTSDTRSPIVGACHPSFRRARQCRVLAYGSTRRQNCHVHWEWQTAQ